MFEPTTLPTAIDGLPSNAEKILTISSGNDVPNATTVKPITKDEIPNLEAILELPLTIHSAPK
jgi:hypothetical protein